MLAKKFRLPVNTFPLRARILYKGQHLAVKTSANNLPYNRIGIIITKKSAPKAAERNRLRRRVFDLFGEETRLRFAKAPADAKALAGKSAGKDLLVLVKPIKLDRDAEGKLFKELNSIKEIIHERDRLSPKSI